MSRRIIGGAAIATFAALFVSCTAVDYANRRAYADVRAEGAAVAALVGVGMPREALLARLRERGIGASRISAADARTLDVRIERRMWGVPCPEIIETVRVRFDARERVASRERSEHRPCR